MHAAGGIPLAPRITHDLEKTPCLILNYFEKRGISFDSNFASHTDLFTFHETGHPTFISI
jgi:hypothetical protein